MDTLGEAQVLVPIRRPRKDPVRVRRAGLAQFGSERDLLVSLMTICVSFWLPVCCFLHATLKFLQPPPQSLAFVLRVLTAKNRVHAIQNLPPTFSQCCREARIFASFHQISSSHMIHRRDFDSSLVWSKGHIIRISVFIRDGLVFAA